MYLICLIKSVAIYVAVTLTSTVMYIIINIIFWLLYQSILKVNAVMTHLVGTTVLYALFFVVMIISYCLISTSCKNKSL